MRSILECVLEHAERRPQHPCVQIVSRRKPHEGRTYADIAAAAARGAGFLAAHGVGRGDPVALIGSHHLDLYAAWLGALWLGAIPTLLAEPSVRIDKGIYWSRLAALLDRSQVKTILVEPGIDIASGPAERLRRFTYEEIAAGGHPTPRKVEVEADSLVVLQHSSGTTGLQKGVVLTHGMVMRNAAAQFQRLGICQDDTTANWLPLFHDLGLVCSFMLPLISGGSMVWLSPFEWVGSPGLLLEAITRYRATVTWLPNFAFGFLAQSVSEPAESFDLSTIRAVFSGGEPATESSMDAFYRRYQKSGLKREALHVGYGMAEAVGGVAHTGVDSPPRYRRISKRRWAEDHVAAPPEGAEESIVHVSSGPALGGCELRVVDAEKKPVPPHRAGRILLRSTYMFSGYYRRDDLNQGLFDGEGFFDTGDVGYLDEDGHIYVTGRIKELIKVSGRTIYPQDVEDVLNTIHGVHPGRAVCFGVALPGRGTEGLVALAESDLPEAEWPALVGRIRTAIVQATDVDVLDAKVIARNTLRKSTAGKLARDGNREWYLAGRFGAVPAAVTGQTSARDTLGDCLYTLEWRPAALAANAAPRSQKGAWLVVLDGQGTGAAVAERLRALGEACVEVTAGPTQIERVLAETFGKDRVCKGVVHCQSLDAAPWDRTSAESLVADLDRSALLAVAIVQALARRGSRDAPRFVGVTRGAWAGSIGQAPLWGLGRTIALEHPELECTLVDLPAEPLADEASLVAREIVAGDGEDRVALRAEGRFVARLAHGKLDAAEVPRGTIAADGGYLITGGLGALGLATARWLVAQGARHLALAGRSAPSEAAREAIRALEAAGAQVTVLRGDVSRAADMEQIVEQAKARLPTLRGVVHAAAALDDRTLLETREEQLRAPARPMVLGAWNLHTATRGLALDFFVTYGSVTGLLGSSGQGNHAAASAFLDALAQARTAAGLPATNIAWGPVAAAGISEIAERRRQRMSSQGIASFTPEEAEELLSRLFASKTPHDGAASGPKPPRTQAGLVRLSMRQWLESHPQAAGMRSLSELENEKTETRDDGALLRRSLEKAAPAERASIVETFVVDQLGRVLGRDLSGLDRRAPFMSLGVDSLMGIDLRNRLEAGLGVRLAATILFTYPSPAALADHLLATVAPAAPPAAPAKAAPTAEPAKDLLDLGGDELLAKLGEELSLARKHGKAS